MIRRALGAILWAGLLSWSAWVFSAEAQSIEGPGPWSVGTGLSFSYLDPDPSGTIYSVRDHRDRSVYLDLGYDWSTRLSSHFRIVKLGHANFNPDGRISYRAVDLSARYAIYDPGWDHRGLRLSFRAGLSLVKIDSDVPYQSENSIHPGWGLGVAYGLRHGLSLVLDYDFYTPDAQALLAGVTWRFSSWR